MKKETPPENRILSTLAMFADFDQPAFDLVSLLEIFVTDIESDDVRKEEGASENPHQLTLHHGRAAVNTQAVHAGARVLWYQTALRTLLCVSYPEDISLTGLPKSGRRPIYWTNGIKESLVLPIPKPRKPSTQQGNLMPISRTPNA